MKQIKKLASLLLVLAMAFALSCTAFAETSQYTITISNAVKDTTYSAYKIFDATYSGNAVSYTIPDGSNIATAEGFDGVFATTANGGKTYVTVKDGVDYKTVIDWLEAYTVSGNPDAFQKNSDGTATVTLNVGAAGYYYVGSTPAGEGTSAAVSLTTVTTAATVVDKNSTKPGIDTDDGKKVAVSENGTYGSVATMDVGSTAYFKITYNATNYVVENGTATQIGSYTITDTPDGFIIDSSSVAVKVGDKTLTPDDEKYTVSVNKTNDAMTITIPWVDGEGTSLYTSPSDVEITYTATLTDKNAAEASSNEATIEYNGTKIPDVPGTEVYNYKIVIDKYDSSNEDTKLQGAEFVLKNNDGKFYKVGENGVVTWVNAQSDATVVTTNESGAASFIGLKADTYTLVETKAPAGYNLGKDKTITLNAITEKLTDTKSLTVTEKVANSAGSTLPTTGGMGTTLLYTVGTLLVLGAGVTLVVRRRMDANK